MTGDPAPGTANIGLARYQPRGLNPLGLYEDGAPRVGSWARGADLKQATRSWRAAVGLLVLGGMAVLGAGCASTHQVAASATTTPVVGDPPATVVPVTLAPARTRVASTTTRVAAQTTVAPGIATTATTVPAARTARAVPGSGICADPIFSTSSANGAINIDPSPAPENWWVNNDAWNASHGPQTLKVCSQSRWYAVSDQPNHAGAVETYADTEYDVGGRKAPSTEPISRFSSITSTFSEAYPPAGSWDAAYDLWLNNWSIEVMIWTQWAGAQGYWPGIATHTLTLDGVPYRFYKNGSELMFFRASQTTSGSVNILAAFQWLVSQGYVSSSDVPTQLEYGVEIASTSGSETFPMTGLTFHLS